MTANAEYLISHGWTRVDHGIVCGIRQFRWRKGEITMPEHLALEVQAGENREKQKEEWRQATAGVKCLKQ